MSTTTTTRERPTTATPSARPERSTDHGIVTIVGSPSELRRGVIAALAEVVVIEPTEAGKIGELFDLWDEEDDLGDPEEQQRSLDLLLRRLDEDRS